MWHVGFGLFDSKEELEAISYELTKGLFETTSELTSMQVKYILTQRYEELYGIRDYSVPDAENPYPLVALNAKEDVYAVSPLFELMNTFIRERVHTHTGMTLDRFLQLPRHWVEHILQSCGKLNNAEALKAKELQASMAAAKEASDPLKQFRVARNKRK